MKKLTHFEGLRGIAAFIVFLAHFRPAFCLNLSEDLLNDAGINGPVSRSITLNIITILYDGALPVFIFWLMSAYVLSIKLFNPDKTRSETYLVEGSMKRYFRLAMPVAAASLFCFLLLKAGLFYNIALARQLGPGYVDGWLNQQYHFIPGFIHFLRTTFIEVFMNGNCNYNFALWTMTPEFLGSLLCFAFFAMMGTHKKRYLVYLSGITLLTFGGFREVTYLFYVTFLVGIMWCDAVNSTDEDVLMRSQIRKIFHSKWTTFILLMGSFTVPILSDLYYHLPANFIYFFAFPVKAMAITIGVHQYGIIRKLLSTRLMRFMGRISFSFYLLHIPVLLSVGGYLYMNGNIPAGYRLLVVFISVLSVLIALSALFEKYIDRNSIKLASLIGKYLTAPKKEHTPKITIRPVAELTTQQ